MIRYPYTKHRLDPKFESRDLGSGPEERKVVHRMNGRGWHQAIRSLDGSYTQNRPGYLGFTVLTDHRSLGGPRV